MRKILVLHGAMYGGAIKDLGDMTSRSEEFLKDPKSFDLILFTGGEDVSPSLYGEASPKGLCGNSMRRDVNEMAIYKLARKHNVKMVGICRGIQFLNVMAGGKMFHDVNNHAGQLHDMRLLSGRVIRINSYHHQMVRPPEDAKIVGWADKRLSTYYCGENDERVGYDGVEPEVVIYPNCRSFGAQYHPEMIPEKYDAYKFFWQMVSDSLSMKWEDFVTSYTKEKDHDEYDKVQPAEDAKSVSYFA